MPELLWSAAAVSVTLAAGSAAVYFVIQVFQMLTEDEGE